MVPAWGLKIVSLVFYTRGSLSQLPGSGRDPDLHLAGDLAVSKSNEGTMVAQFA